VVSEASPFTELVFLSVVCGFLESKAAKRKATILNSFGYVLSDGFLEAKQQSAKQPF
jgi:hypothetical protein